MKDIAIWDLDNCLSNDAWRLSKVNWTTENMDDRYAAYHEDCDRDAPGNLAIYAAVRLVREPVFFTARPDAVRTKTRRWITHHLGEVAPLIYMRGDRQNLSTVQLKRRMLVNFLNGVGRAMTATRICANSIVAFDDREDMVEMYRAAGIQATQLKIHNVCALTPPVAVLLPNIRVPS